MKNLGDGLMVVFDGVTAALDSAVAMQQALAARRTDASPTNINRSANTTTKNSPTAPAEKSPDSKSSCSASPRVGRLQGDEISPSASTLGHALETDHDLEVERASNPE